ncbi:Acyl-CoA synthetase (AMP-forming)/AMP-acid ligase II [Gaiella occulta]|uniref:Acyl-CoA synthetase (AMP-forming)/AMP-acid ligase II n=1 Tax=Gaiella occulta TaxID=1002870 RepID=A0A7M2YW58_9ACTN|nr:long-chain fatty acid--CoA ligase [Gaiella occulta]RDI74371.1 Acyl-CoA synthetase (AMP-forming)/AMP-acid ligase II [Gaiella occulta]
MMDYQLTLPALLRRADTFFGSVEIVTRLPDGSLHRSTYADLARRSAMLAAALRALGIQPGDRVATLCRNHSQHLEAYFGIPLAGAVTHTLNFRLHPDDLAYIAGHAGDRAVVVDQSLLPVLDEFRARAPFEHVLVVRDDGPPLAERLDFEVALGEADTSSFLAFEPDEKQAAAMCYTSGTTGRPKGVLYSHRAIVLHSLVCAHRDALDIGESDVVLPVVPMFHVNAWGLPYTATLVGAKQVLPGLHTDAAGLLELLADQGVTVTAGVPTVWLAVLDALDRDPRAYDLSRLRSILVGGAAAPEAMIRAFQERHGLHVVHLWGMTEMTPLGTVSKLGPALASAPDDVRRRYQLTQGRPVPLVEARAHAENGPVPWDGRTPGELEVAGPWVVSSYYGDNGLDDRFTGDGWFRTGDIVTIDPLGFVSIQDRAKDLIKSGGEWISSVALENALMGHPAVAEAAVVAVPHPKWQERPLAAVVLREGHRATGDELREHLAPHFASWWLPDAVEFVDEIPRTAAGKFRKSALRERFSSYWEGES